MLSMTFSTSAGLRHFLLVDELGAFELRNVARGNCMRLVPAGILAARRIDETNGDRRHRRSRGACKQRRDRRGRNDIAASLEQIATGQSGSMHLSILVPF